ncbi:hypothetical protein [Saezia sanguinis]|uniref:hypothetical protein n=1 Tax=Saezia sanguinis TaxID=1965230 RepID=UPI0030D8EE04
MTAIPVVGNVKTNQHDTLQAWCLVYLPSLSRVPERFKNTLAVNRDVPKYQFAPSVGDAIAAGLVMRANTTNATTSLQ